MPRIDDTGFWRAQMQYENQDGLPHRPETYDEYIKRFERAIQNGRNRNGGIRRQL